MKKIIYVLVCVILFSLNDGVYAEQKEVTLKKCVDGDTARFIMNGKEIKARFLAIDTPESVHPTIEDEAFGKEASEYTCDLLTKAEEIVLEYDPKSSKTDKYDRHLVWVFVDDVLLQEELISKGFAQIDYVYGDYKYVEQLETVEEKAKNKKIGVWSENIEEKTSKKDDNKDEEIVIKKSDLKSILNSIHGILKKLLEIIETIVNDVL